MILPMLTIQKIQNLPENKREQLLWAIVITVFILLVGLWIITSQIPKNKKTPQDFFIAIQRKALQAKAGFGK